MLVAVGAPNMGRLIDRFGPRRVLAAGLAVFTVGYALYLRVGAGFGYAPGFALAFPSLNAAATARVADREQGLASGLVNTSFQLGGAVVLAVVTAIVAGGHGRASGDGLPHGYLAGLGVISTVTLLALVLVGPPRRRSRRSLFGDQEGELVARAAVARAATSAS